MTMRLIDAEAAGSRKIKVRGIPAKRPDGQAVRPVDTGGKIKAKDIAAMAGTEYIAYIDGEQSVQAHK